MKKNVKTKVLVAGLVFALSFSTIASAKQLPKIQQKNSKNKGMVNEKLKNKTTKELEKINSKLDKIEKDIKYTSEKINKYFSTSVEGQETEDVTDQNQDVTNEEVESVTDENQDATTEEVKDVTGENQDITTEEIKDVTNENQDATTEEIKDVTNENQDATTEEIKDVTDESQDATTEEVKDVTNENQDATTEEVKDVTDENQDATTEEVKDVTDENQDATTEEEESISGYSFIGKLNALNNRLEAIKKHLDSPSNKIDKTNQEYAKIVDRITKLKKDISDNVEKLKSFQSPVLEKLKNKVDEQKEYTPKNKLVETNKTWTIKFNKNLKLESFNGTNIFVVDSNSTLVETIITFDKETGAIKITPVENYIKGKKYTLFISKDVKSDKGSLLRQATKVPFEIQ